MIIDTPNKSNWKVEDMFFQSAPEKYKLLQDARVHWNDYICRFLLVSKQYRKIISGYFVFPNWLSGLSMVHVVLSTSQWYVIRVRSSNLKTSLVAMIERANQLFMCE